MNFTDRQIELIVQDLEMKASQVADTINASYKWSDKPQNPDLYKLTNEYKAVLAIRQLQAEIALLKEVDVIKTKAFTAPKPIPLRGPDKAPRKKRGPPKPKTTTPNL
jgi:hypothetical protein